MRYGKEHKGVTRQRMVEAAGRRFKEHGIDGSGVSTLMADVGLTNAALYAHFTSKEDLVAAALVDQLRQQGERFSGYTCDRAGLEQFVREYLSMKERDDPANGCPCAALLGEIGRCSVDTKQTFTDTIVNADDIASRMAPDDPQSARVEALTLFAMMAGTMQLARALADRQFAKAVLDQGIQNALTLLATNQRR
jgi:TetR/AcrR family transcriptional regulator, transcriptional repressor for nem operon